VDEFTLSSVTESCVFGRSACMFAGVFGDGDEQTGITL